MTDLSASEVERAGSGDAGFGDYVALLKPRVMSLVIFTALAGMLAARADAHPIVGLAALICIAVGAGASGALNMWWDADIDALMSRTARRPVPSGIVAPDEALALGIGLSVISVFLLAVFANLAAAALLAFTIFFYAVIYTMWLKRATPQNIVIGGAAGAFPPMIGWVAVSGDITTASILMFAIIFLWTPPHFWALALYRNGDYARAGVPMLPVVAGQQHTRNQIWWYSWALVIVSLLPVLTTVGGPVGLATAIVGGALFLNAARAVKIRSAEDARLDRHKAEKRLFFLSIFYLFGIFAAFIIDSVLHRLGWISWPGVI